MGITGVRRGIETAPACPAGTRAKAVLGALLLVLSMAPMAALAFGPSDGLYSVAGNSNLLVQTLTSGLTVVTRTNYSQPVSRYDVTLYVGSISGNKFRSTAAYGHTGTPPELELNFSSGDFKLTFPGSPPTVTTEPVSNAGCGAPTTNGPFDGPYFGDGGLLLVHSFPCGCCISFVIVHHVFGTTESLQGSIYYTRLGLSGTTFNAEFLLRASPTAAVSIDFPTRVLTRTPSGASPVSLPMFPAIQ